ncbi:unnamed protein product [Didymodactylos carnosus]|uniref:Uncharacterized protein n=1 Tax=Didymodactylos carnosus TaxID=1234261 RepID=A0A813RKL3_9BILA|nr:unnamed protein product [Didymodactylos carnosus]CAF0885001.1 unnamed protein product [Didymodactylos carnosus]CAF3565872.1 unnamed protein product [Didymodactylos carnosus]CAF3668051.1 unnamed protein product [Didymodactylos carnosus]
MDPNSTSNDEWQNSFDRFLRQHDQQQQPLSTTLPLNNQRMDDLSFNSHINDVWGQPRLMQNNEFNMFNDFLNSSHYTQQPPPIGIPTFSSSSSSTSDSFLQQQNNRQPAASLPYHSPDSFLPISSTSNRKIRTTPDNNFDFGLPPSSPPTSSYFKSMRASPTSGTGRRPLPPTIPRLPRRSPPGMIIPSHQKQRTPPLLQVSNDETAHLQQHSITQRAKQNSPLYVACINHGSNHNGVLGPPVLLPPSF